MLKKEAAGWEGPAAEKKVGEKKVDFPYIISSTP
jgi:hypothetical protein